MNSLRIAFRSLRNRLGFSLGVILVLAMGIGVNTAMFSLVDNLLFSPMQVAEPERLVRLFRAGSDPADGELGERDNWSYPDYRNLREQMDSVQGMAVFVDWLSIHLAEEGGEPTRVTAAAVSSDYFRVLGTEPELGTPFSGDELQHWGAMPQVVLSHRLWQRRFGGQPDVIGRDVLVNGHAFTVVAVMPAGFTGANRDQAPELWAPIAMFSQVAPGWGRSDIREAEGTSFLDIVARLAPGVTAEQAQAELRTLTPDLRSDGRDMSGYAVPAAEASVDAYGGGELQRMSWLLLGVVGLVLLVACADAASLMLVRGEERQHEMAVRLGLGARRRHVMTQLFTESLMLALAGAALGVLLAWWLVVLLPLAVPSGLPIPMETASSVLAPRVLVFTAAVAVAAAVVAGLVPAWRATRTDLTSGLKHEQRAVGSAPRQFLLRNGFVITQIALSVVLLIGAALFARTLQNGVSVDPGFPVDELLMAGTNLSQEGYTPETGLRFYRDLAEGLEAHPGFADAAVAFRVPVASGSMRTSLDPEGVEAAEGEIIRAELNTVTPGYPRALGMRLERGRDFSWADGPDAPKVVMVNQAFMDRYWPERDPLGLGIEGIGAGDRVEVVGVVSDVHQTSLREPQAPTVYIPMAQRYMPSFQVLVRTEGEPAMLKDDLRQVFAALDPRLPIYRVQTMEERIGSALGRERMFATVMSLFGVLALILSATGLYGLIAYSTRLRTREFGVRIAVGAGPGRILRQVLGDGMVLGVAGLCLGFVGAVLLARTVESLLFGITPTDPSTYLLVGAAFLVVAAVASLFPARRATRIQPLEALRHE